MAREKVTLPFEITYSERPSEKSKNMKRLAFIIRPQNLDDIILSLRETCLEATIYDVKGVGKEDRERVTSGRGSGTSDLAYILQEKLSLL